jgi:dihydroorotase
MRTITIKSPLDMHLHLRDNDMLDLVAPLSSGTFAKAIIMPNLVPPVDTLEAVNQYKQRIVKATSKDNFEPLMTLFFKPYSKEFLETVKDNISAIKLYPAGITTNSDGGVECIDTVALKPTLDAMAQLDIPLCVHGETNGFVMDREKEFMSVYESLAQAFPKLKIIMEHITTKDATVLLKKYDNLYATITLHHLLITLDDVAGGMLNPHLFCKPIAKRYEDRDALVKLAVSGDKKVMFGSDSAPHPKHSKENCGCAAGVFTAPIALQLLAELFDEHKSIENLQAFVCDNALEIYGIEASNKTVVLENKPFVVPQIYSTQKEKVVPMYAGKTIAWSVR